MPRPCFTGTSVRFARETYPLPSLPGRESLTAQFLEPGGEAVLYRYMNDLNDGQRMRPEKLKAWAGTTRALQQPRRVQS